MPVSRQIVARLAGLLAPDRCLLCRSASRAPVCRACEADLPRVPAACRVCAAGLPVDGVCGVCQHRPFAFDRIIAPFQYLGPVAWLIRELKYQRRPEIARALAGIFLSAIEPRIGRPDLLVPVPLFRWRLVGRGFNQAEELSHHLSKLMDIPVSASLVDRVRDTAAQAGLDEASRRGNVRRAFRCRGGVENAHVCVIDDVVTTAATVHNVALALRRGGARRVDVWAPARA